MHSIPVSVFPIIQQMFIEYVLCTRTYSVLGTADEKTVPVSRFAPSKWGSSHHNVRNANNNKSMYWNYGERSWKPKESNLIHSENRPFKE